jgi:hypothetical protein
MLMITSYFFSGIDLVFFTADFSALGFFSGIIWTYARGTLSGSKTGRSLKRPESMVHFPLIRTCLLNSSMSSVSNSYKARYFLVCPFLFSADIHRVAFIMPGTCSMSGMCVLPYQSLYSSSRLGSLQSLKAKYRYLVMLSSTHFRWQG